MLRIDKDEMDIEQIMGTPGDEIMMGEDFMGVAKIYEYEDDAAMLAATESLCDALLIAGYTAEEATLDRLPATRFTLSGKEEILLAPHTDYPFVYVLVGGWALEGDDDSDAEKGVLYEGTSAEDGVSNGGL